ncbi:MAG: hypothetical protein K2X81_14385 [Candidatus Obscuribacterales bacterium]|nr:hypothetical protein [Candidatus Obscuribacterales bacterium]
MQTPLYPTFRKRITDAFEQLIRQQVIPWSFMNAGPPFRIKSFDGRQIAYGGVGFEGSPSTVFWSRYIEPFLEQLCISEIEEAVSMAKEKAVDARLLLPELQGLLFGGITKVYEHMADVDRRLRGKGYPNSVALRSVKSEVQRMETFVAERIQAELEMWKPKGNAEFETVDLLDHQKTILLELVKADHSVPLEHRGRFIVSEAMGQPPSVAHRGLPENLDVGVGDIESLGDANLLRLGRGSGGSLKFTIAPLGFRYAQWLREQTGEPLLRVSDTVRAYLGAAQFQNQHKVAYQKWTQAEAALWGEDSANQLTTIGHLCREVLQDFCTELIAKHQPPQHNADKAKTVDRLRSVFKHHQSTLGQGVTEFLGALVGYWGALSDLVQRQEHGAAKEGEPLTWEDAQRVVFHTAVVMWEIDRSLVRIQSPR